MDTKELKALALRLGADAVGKADLNSFLLEDFPLDLPDSIHPFTRATSLAVSLSDSVLDHSKVCFSTRKDAIDLKKCSQNLTKDFARKPGIEKPICGVCIFGKERKKPWRTGLIINVKEWSHNYCARKKS